MPRSTQYAAISRSPSRTSGFTLRAKPVVGREHRVLAPEVAGLPAQHVAEQHRGFVVEVVAGGDDVVAVLERGRVEEVALREPARAARRAAGDLRRGRGCRSRGRSRRSTSCSFRPRALRERRGRTGRTRRSTRRCRARGRGRRPRTRASTQEVPERQRVLAAGDRDEHPLPRLEHLVLVDRLAHLLPAVVQEAVPAERRVVPADVDDRRRLAPPALHRSRAPRR